MYRDFFSNNLEFSLFLKYFLDIDISHNNLIKYESSYITEDYMNRRSDVVYKIKNKPIYIFLEHQSSIDYSISYRIFNYYSLILRDTTDYRYIKKKDYRLPCIIPILLYTGNKKWKLIPNLKNKQEDNPFRKDIHNFKYDFVNIFNYSIQELLNINSMIAYLLATDKCTSTSELLDVLEKLSNIVTDTTRKHSIQRLIIYIYKDYLKYDTSKELLKKFEEGDDVSMKYAWDYVREDLERQRELNRKEGRKEGFVDATRNFIVKMLKNGESIDKIKLYSGYSKSEIEELKKELNLA